MSEEFTIITIDPGIDVTGVAVWRPAFAKPGMEGAACALRDIRSVRSKASDSSIARCYSIYKGMGLVFYSHNPTAAWIEIPPTWHVKTMKKLGYGDVIEAHAKLNRAVGAIAAACGAQGMQIHEAPASKMEKKLRLDLAEQLCRAAGVKIPKNEDERSAVYIGLEVIAKALYSETAMPMVLNA
jgi:Holliday junction resolvasome RuvABC endonuclease subunit